LQGLQAGVLPFDTTHVPQIAFEIPGMAFDADSNLTSNGVVHEPHVDLGDGPRLQIAHPLPLGCIDLSHPGPYFPTPDWFNGVPIVQRVPNGAPWSSHDARIDESNFLTPWGGGAQGLSDFVVCSNMSPPQCGHTRTSSSLNLHLYNGCTSIRDMLVPWRQAAYASASFPNGFGRCVVLNSQRLR